MVYLVIKNSIKIFQIFKEEKLEKLRFETKAFRNEIFETVADQFTNELKVFERIAVEQDGQLIPEISFGQPVKGPRTTLGKFRIVNNRKTGIKEKTAGFVPKSGSKKNSWDSGYLFRQ